MTLFAFAWVGGLGGFAGLLLNANDGVEWLLAALLPTIAYDVFGFFVGQQFGKSPIAPRISPNKTIEGTAVGVLASVVIGAAIIVRLDPFESHASWAVLVGLGAGLAALFGDLCESMIKRDLGIKDFSGSLPGHGGVLDRFDGLLFAMPVVFFLMIHFPS
jgi:phosphatidate cytidylyltransferase